LTVVQLRVLRKSDTIEPGRTTYKVHIKRTYKVSQRNGMELNLKLKPFSSNWKLN